MQGIDVKKEEKKTEQNKQKKRQKNQSHRLVKISKCSSNNQIIMMTIFSSCSCTLQLLLQLQKLNHESNANH